MEHSLGDYKKIIDWIHSINLKDMEGKEVRACVRELRAIDITVDESCAKELVSYLHLEHGHVDSGKMKLMTKIAQKFSPLEPFDTSDIEFKKVNTGRPKQTFAYFHIMGVLPDEKTKDGKDRL